MDENDDPYQILGVSKDSSAADIKKAYRTLALKYHPDKQGNDADREKASAKFAKIAAAYEILSDDEERKQYDLRKKYGGAPGTRYTTTSEPSPMSPSRSNNTQRVYTTSPSRSTRTTCTTKKSPESGTFNFSYDPSKVRSSNPYDIFREVFGSDFKQAYPGAELSPSKTHRTKSVPINMKNSLSTPKPKKSTMTQASPRQCAVSGDDVVSMSKSTKTICHDDGSQEIITETTITTADGSTKTSRESSRTVSSSRPTSTRTIKPSSRTYITSK